MWVSNSLFKQNISNCWFLMTFSDEKSAFSIIKQKWVVREFFALFESKWSICYISWCETIFFLGAPQRQPHWLKWMTNQWHNIVFFFFLSLPLNRSHDGVKKLLQFIINKLICNFSVLQLARSLGFNSRIVESFVSKDFRVHNSTPIKMYRVP